MQLDKRQHTNQHNKTSRLHVYTLKFAVLPCTICVEPLHFCPPHEVPKCREQVAL